MAGKYACLDGEGIIQNIFIATSAELLPSCFQVLPFEPGMDIGKKKIDGVWTDTSMILFISLNKYEANLGETITANASVANRDKTITHAVSGTYHVPVIRDSDGWQAKLLEVVFSAGQASVDFSINEPGIYTVDLTKVYPTPQSELAESPILIVKES